MVELVVSITTKHNNITLGEFIFGRDLSLTLKSETEP